MKDVGQVEIEAVMDCHGEVSSAAYRSLVSKRVVAALPAFGRDRGRHRGGRPVHGAQCVATLHDYSPSDAYLDCNAVFDDTGQ